jgi:hypothetical protein
VTVPMSGNRLIFDKDGTLWVQVVRDGVGKVLEGKDRTVLLANDLDRAVADFVEFCAKVGGDRYRSAISAMYDLRGQSGQLVEKVDEAALESEVENSGDQLDRVIELSKALEWYYLDNFVKVAGSGD